MPLLQPSRSASTEVDAVADNVIFGPSLADAFLTAGLPYQGESQTGKMHRFPTSENDRADKSGWLRIFPDGDGAAFGCWRHGASFVWQRRDDGAPPPSDAERAAARAKADAANREAELQRVEKHTKGAATAARIWGETLDLGAHGYIAKKGVKPHDARLDLDGRMVLPVHDADGIIQSLQFIAADGEKRFLPGGKMQGGRLFLGAPVDGSPLLLCEGFATGKRDNHHHAGGLAQTCAGSEAFTEQQRRTVSGSVKE